MLSRIAEHDIGLALELTQPDSRNLTVTYKLFHYLLAGLTVVATRTAGQSEIAAAAPQAISLCDSQDADSLAFQINQLVENPDRLAKAKQAALDAAKNCLCREKQTPLLCEAIDRALHSDKTFIS